MSWSIERVDLLKDLWAKGVSCSQIARELGNATRNAVIGKIHRLGLSGRAKASAKPSKAMKPKFVGTGEPPSPLSAQRPPSRAKRIIEMAKAAGVTLERRRPRSGSIPGSAADREKVVKAESRRAMAAFVAPATGGVLLENLPFAGRCKWPFGERAPFVFCGHKVTDGTPLAYCPAHFFAAVQGVCRGREVLVCSTASG